MKRTMFLAVPAVLILGSMPSAWAAAGQKNQSLPADARTALRDVGDWASDIAEDAFHLDNLALTQRDPRGHLDGLEAIRDDVNHIGAALQALDQERASLAPWEAKALDDAMPLMRQVADRAQKAIETFRSDPTRLWANSYIGDMEEIAKDADRVATELHDYLKLEATRETESRLEQTLGK